MSNLNYSLEAEESKGLFYNKKYTVYVEGIDDVIFWTNLFDLAKIEAHVEDVGGENEVSKKIKDIIEKNASFIVACDADHSDFIGVSKHRRIIRTYGYSIENSMYCSLNLHAVIRNLSKKNINVKSEIEKWAESFSNNLYELIIYDIANRYYNKGIKVLGNNCLRFLKNNNSKDVSKKEVSDYINSNLEKHFTKDEINKIKHLVSNSDKKLWYHIKGHFLTHGVINLIQYYVKSITGSKSNISLDSLYALTIDCTSSFHRRKDIRTVIKSIEAIE